MCCVTHSDTYNVTYCVTYNVTYSNITYTIGMTCCMHTGSRPASQDTMYYMHMGSRTASQVASQVASQPERVVHTGSRTVSQVASQPERVVRMVDDDVKTIATGGAGAFATRAGKEKAVKVDITGYVSNMELAKIELVNDSFVGVISGAYIPYSLNILREKIFIDLEVFDLPRKFYP